MIFLPRRKKMHAWWWAETWKRVGGGHILMMSRKKRRWSPSPSREVRWVGCFIRAINQGIKCGNIGPPHLFLSHHTLLLREQSFCTTRTAPPLHQAGASILFISSSLVRPCVDRPIALHTKFRPTITDGTGRRLSDEEVSPKPI